MTYVVNDICPLTGINKSELRREIKKQLELFEELVHEELEKSDIRSLHSGHLAEFHKKNIKFWNSNKSYLSKILIDGSCVNPEKIQPILLEVTSNEKLRTIAFRLAKFNWSVPPSNGFGRRLRFLVWDKYHNALIGVIGLTDPVFNLKVRDEFIGWNVGDRNKRLVSVLDAFMLGALPPYSNLLGGKLVASLLNSEEISKIFAKKYKNSTGVISGELKKSKLAAITTTSVLGRSSVYNRLKLDGDHILRNIGYTSGFGHFQFSIEIFEKLKQLVAAVDDDNKVSFDFGNGPNWKIRVIREGLRLLELNQNYVKHGIKRSVYYCSHYKNAEAYLNGTESRLLLKTTKKTKDLSDMALKRWVVPRSQRDQSFKSFRVADWIENVEHKLDTLNENC